MGQYSIAGPELSLCEACLCAFWTDSGDVDRRAERAAEMLLSTAFFDIGVMGDNSDFGLKTALRMLDSISMSLRVRPVEELISSAVDRSAVVNIEHDISAGREDYERTTQKDNEQAVREEYEQSTWE
jgi:hypothetical protein